MKIVVLMLVSGVLLTACNNKPPATSSFDEQLFLREGDSIAALAQNILLSNVTQAIQTNGVAGAVSFCSEKATTITDSASALYGYTIQRLSDKNRNPQNAIQTAQDSAAWRQLLQMMQDTLATKKHLVIHNNDSTTYYKAITIAMPTCLKCHGDKQTDISPEVLAAINKKYPNDKATGYHSGELRGMWKIETDDMKR